MTIDKQEVDYLLRLCQERPPKRRLGAVARRLQQEYRIGRTSGLAILYTSECYQRAASLLKLIGIDPETPASAWAQGGRAEAAALGGSEKWSPTAVHAGMVAVKALPGRMLLIGATELRLPQGAHLEIDAAEVVGSVHTSLLIVENFESFRYCGRWEGLDLTRCGGNPLLIYRGDSSGVRADAVVELITLSEKPVFAAYDLDPAGLGLALGLPRLDGFIRPSDQHLESWIERGRVDLYLNQVGQWGALLDKATHPDIAIIWTLLRKHGKGVPQEIFNREFVDN